MRVFNLEEVKLFIVATPLGGIKFGPQLREGGGREVRRREAAGVRG